MKIVFLILFSFLLFSCCTEKRAIELLKTKYSNNGKVDIITVVDTIVTNSVKIDTFIANIPKTDTVFLEKEKLKVSFFVKNDTIFVNAKCKQDTFFVEKEVIRIPPSALKKSFLDDLPIYTIAFLVGVITVFAFAFTLRSILRKS